MWDSKLGLKNGRRLFIDEKLFRLLKAGRAPTKFLSVSITTNLRLNSLYK